MATTSARLAALAVTLTLTLLATGLPVARQVSVIPVPDTPNDPSPSPPRQPERTPTAQASQAPQPPPQTPPQTPPPQTPTLSPAPQNAPTDGAQTPAVTSATPTAEVAAEAAADSSGLSGGAIAGIVIGALVALLLLVLCIVAVVFVAGRRDDNTQPAVYSSDAVATPPPPAPAAAAAAAVLPPPYSKDEARALGAPAPPDTGAGAGAGDTGGGGGDALAVAAVPPGAGTPPPHDYVMGAGPAATRTDFDDLHARFEREEIGDNSAVLGVDRASTEARAITLPAEGSAGADGETSALPSLVVAPMARAAPEEAGTDGGATTASAQRGLTEGLPDREEMGSATFDTQEQMMAGGDGSGAISDAALNLTNASIVIAEEGGDVPSLERDPIELAPDRDATF